MQAHQARRAAFVRVTGLVQGVGFRYAAYAMAKRLGLAGWVRNEDDGSVASEFEGEPANVQRYIEWLGSGPPGARIEGVEVKELSPRGAFAAFTIEY